MPAMFRARLMAATAMGTPAWRARILRNPALSARAAPFSKTAAQEKPQVRNTGQKNMEKNTARVRAWSPKNETITPQPRKA